MLKTLTLTAIAAATLFAAASLQAQAASTDRSGMTAYTVDQSQSGGNFGPVANKTIFARSSDCNALKEMAERMSTHDDRDAIKQYIACLNR